MDADHWQRLLAARVARQSGGPVPPGLLDSPYRAMATAGGPFVVAQLGQSLDGRIATAGGHSHYINGPAALDHLHRLRALADAILVGAGTLLSDDPALTVRRCPGPSPVRVVLDSRGALTPERRVFQDRAAPTLLVTAAAAPFAGLPPEIEVLPMGGDGLAPTAVLTALAARGLRVVLVEGGARTVSRFLAAGCLDRLHLMVAPLIIGSGPVGLDLPAIDRLEAAQRPLCRTWPLGEDVLFDCDLRGG